MKFNVSDVAKLLGFTSSAVRFVEKQKLINVKKSDSGWRYYDNVAVFRLLSYKKYRAMGMSLKTIVKQFSGHENDRALILERMEKLKAEAYEKSAHYRRLAETIESRLESMRNIDKLLGKYEFCRSPDVCLVYDEDHGWLSQDPRALAVEQKLVDDMPATQLAVLLTDPTAGRATFCYSLPISSDVPPNPKIFTHKLKGTDCLHTVVSVQSSFVSNPATAFEEPLAYAAGRRFEVCGKPWGNILLVEVEHETRLHPYIELWIPIR